MRFAPGQLVDRIITGGVETIGEKREVTALFADLVGYTPLAERTEPSELVELLNGYYEQMSAAIEDHRGHVSTFLGDGMLALFGALEPNPWQGDDAVHAALAMRERLAVYNAELERHGKAPLAVGIGLHRGTGVAGLVGSHGKKEFAIVGRVVNVAARVQAATREQETDILITDDLARENPRGFSVTHPTQQVQAARSPATPSCKPLRRAAEGVARQCRLDF